MVKTALCLLTCNRPELTRQTVTSLQKYVPLQDFILLHGDDSSDCRENHDIAKSVGFKTVFQTRTRRGVAFMWNSLIHQAKDNGAQFVFMQENDWQWIRPLDPQIIKTFQKDESLYNMRFWGAFKDEQKQLKSVPLHQSKGIEPNWKPYMQGWEVGDIHWCYPPNITRIEEAIYLSRGEREGACIERSRHISKLVLRPTQNYVFHIGHERTGGFVR